MLRAGARAESRVGNFKTAPTLQQELDQACVRASNLLAEFDREYSAMIAAQNVG